jgi:hypothetical protein
VTTFLACSSPAPTPVKPQPAPAILSQESVHTMLSITHHTRKRSSTGPRTTLVLNLLLVECIDNTHTKVTREKKKKRNETNKMKTPTNDRKPNKGKEQDHLKKTSLGPLRQGQRFDTSETKQNSSKERKPPNQSSNTHKELPLHTCKLPLNQCNSPWTNACKPLENSAAVTTSAHTGQTGHHHRSDRCPTCAQDQHSDWSDR